MTILAENWQTGWESALEALRAELSPSRFSTFFGNARAMGFADGCLTIGTANVFVKSYIESNLRELLVATVSRVFGETVAVRIVVSPELLRERLQERAQNGECDEVPAEKNLPVAEPLFNNSREKFATFVSGGCNEFALAAAKRVVLAPGEFSPLVLYGAHGLGKTHLLRAICHEASVSHPRWRIVCLSAENFVREFARAVVDKHLLAFRERFENCDLLAIDDFHILGEGSKLATQKEFTQIMEQIQSRGAQVVVATSLAPAAIENLHPPLLSRLRQGLLARIDPLDAVTRRAIIMRLSEGLTITPEIADYLSGMLQGDVREIEGAMHKIRLRASLSAVPATVESLGEILEVTSAAPEHFPAEDILRAVAYVYNVPLAEIQGKKRQHSVVLARRAAAHLCRRLAAGSLVEIGSWLGGRTHATILSLLRQPPFARTSTWERQKFAAVIARLGAAIRPDDFMVQQTPLFAE